MGRERPAPRRLGAFVFSDWRPKKITGEGGSAAEGTCCCRHLHIPVVRLERQNCCGPATFRGDRRGSAIDGPQHGQGSLSGCGVRSLAGRAPHRRQSANQETKASPARARLSLRTVSPSHKTRERHPPTPAGADEKRDHSAPVVSATLIPSISVGDQDAPDLGLRPHGLKSGSACCLAWD